MADAAAPTREPIVLQEFEATVARLAPAAVQVLRRRYATALDLSATEEPGHYRLAARDQVGRISLPGGRLLIIRPRVAVTNLFYMLAVQAGLARFEPPPAGLAPDPEIFSFVLALLIRQVELLLRQGLAQSYVPREEDLPVIRGRIVLGAQLRRHGDLKDRHVCAYAAFTPDTPENRIVATTLHALPALLAPTADRALARRARALAARLAGVQVIPRAEALALLRRLTLHRFTAGYAPVLSLCRLVLQCLTLAEQPGPHPFASFLVDMPRLFEAFVTARLRAGLPAAGLRVAAQRWDYLDEERRVGIRPDVLIYPARGTQPRLVLDAKYRLLPAGHTADLSPDLYQVSAYLDRYGLHEGVLVYPQLDAAGHTELRLRGTPKQLHLLTLNLAAPSIAALEAECAAFTARIAALATGAIRDARRGESN